MKGQISEPEIPDTISDCFLLNTALKHVKLVAGKCLPGAPYPCFMLILCKLCQNNTQCNW